MTLKPTSRRIHASPLTFTYLILITLQLFPPTYGYWDSFAFGNGKWFERARDNIGNLQRNATTDIYDCHKISTRNADDPPLDGAIVWNRPNEPAILGLALYADSTCGKSIYALNKGRPLAIMILDKKRLRGLHIANFRNLDGMKPPALIRERRTETAQAIRVSDEIKSTRFLRDIPPEELPNSIVWWDKFEKRHVLNDAVSWANAVLYESLRDKKLTYRFLREVVERAVNGKASMATGNSEALMASINRDAGLGHNNWQLFLPPPDPTLGLTLAGETDDDYGLHIQEFGDFDSKLGPALTTAAGGRLSLVPIPPVTTGRQPRVQSFGIQMAQPEPQLQQVAPVSQLQQGQEAPVSQLESIALENPSLQNNPSTGSADSLFSEERADIPEDLRLALQQIERQVEAHDPTTIIARLDIPADKLTAAFNAASDKKAWLDKIEDRERMNMRVLLLIADWYGEYEEKRRGLQPGTLTTQGSWTNLDINTSELYPELRKVFDRAPDKMLWYSLMESRQKWNMRALRFAKDLYQDWLRLQPMESEDQSMRAHQGSTSSEEGDRDDTFEENAQETQNEVTSILEQNDNGIILQQVQQNAVPEDTIIQIEPNVDAIAEVDNPINLIDPITDSFFAAPDSPTFVTSDEVNLENPASSNPERDLNPRPEAIELENEPQQRSSDIPITITEQQNQPNPRGVLRLQKEGLDPNNPYMIDDLFKYFDPESDAFKDILNFNPRLVQEITKNPGKVLGIPNFGMRHYVPRVPDFNIDLEDSALFDTPSGTISESDIYEEELSPEELREKIAEETAAEAAALEAEGERLEGGPLGSESGEITREEVVESEVPERRRGGGAIEEEILESKGNVEPEPEEVTFEEQIQSLEPLLGGRPASEVMEEIEDELENIPPEEQSRRSTRYNGVRPPPRIRQDWDLEPTFKPRWTANQARRNRRRRSRLTNMADMVEDVPAVQQTTNHEQEPPVRKVEFWDRPLEDRRNRNSLIKTRGSNRDND
ncbi:hypothetical protein AOL_s00006g188 [Orbilia oligospora ATCC 24927]|uniref:Uncharacterized protein n=1 Tax=Arthrobotrys oligospora (strain ATCC 24927 / CBS 115.81 / DSM 1491) TaxID=756982 RepID=G1WZY7_ARTOA|nr:hypothetical protein AOL_s00006g188 [Orbilia oligospora ATCC 24927]EGX53322.1 hypothetical protein AOL_s00006g188 [Orbilia oligospora ATCC 24927]